MAVVPEVAFWMTEAAVKAALKVVVPVEVNEIFPSPCDPPTAPVNVIFPDPAAIVKSLAVEV